MDLTLYRTLLSHFAIQGELVALRELKIGHLHKTLVSDWSTPLGEQSYVHQEINDSVFKDVSALMQNISSVTEHVRHKLSQGKGEEGESTLRIISTMKGDPYLMFEGRPWRTYAFVPDTETYAVCTGADQGYLASKMFGRFQSYLSDLKHQLVDPISSFMDCEKRFAAFKEAVTSDPMRRMKEIPKEIEYVFSQKALFSLIQEGERRGTLPKRPTHGDMKLNNLLFSKSTKRPVCVVDLDTCMNGSYLFDFGDLIRVSSVTVEEDERDLTLVGVDLSLYEGLVQGYGESVRGILNEHEKAILFKAPLLLALTVGTRFLTDYLMGDHYFKISRTHHNLERARCQFQIAKEMENRKDEMRKLTKQAVGL